jgi:hypothetical protein
VVRVSAEALATVLEDAYTRLKAIHERRERTGLYDAPGWRTAVDTVEGMVAQARRLSGVPETVRAEVADMLGDAVGWLETGDGSPAMAADFAGGLDRLHEAIRMLRGQT